jgi:hypothetical protein
MGPELVVQPGKFTVPVFQLEEDLATAAATIGTVAVAVAMVGGQPHVEDVGCEGLSRNILPGFGRNQSDCEGSWSGLVPSSDLLHLLGEARPMFVPFLAGRCSGIVVVVVVAVGGGSGGAVGAVGAVSTVTVNDRGRSSWAAGR